MIDHGYFKRSTALKCNLNSFSYTFSAGALEYSYPENSPQREHDGKACNLSCNERYSAYYTHMAI